MVKFTRNRLQDISKNASAKKIIVFGDLMVDEYLWGDVSRISPEAPVPIINIGSRQLRFGGAANVANNLVGLKATPVLIGVVGEDLMGETFSNMLKENNLPSDGVLKSSDRPTTVKTRIIGNNQHVARVDQESLTQISPELQEQLYQIFVSHIDDVAGIIIQDYNKGLVVPQLVNHITDLANRHGKYITVDPKFENFMSFKNVSVFKPNIKETEQALAVRIRNEDDLIKAGNKLLNSMSCESVLITRGAQGMALFEKNEQVTLVGTTARKVADVSGAGDTVIATLTYALCGGAQTKEAVTLSNYAAGLVCEEVGVVPVNLEKLLDSSVKP